MRAVRRPQTGLALPVLQTGQVTASVSSSSHGRGPLPSVSVVVSTFGRRPFLDGLLGALESQTLAYANFEVVLVDDGSRDDTWERVTDLAEFTPLRLVALRLASSVGQGAGRNTGVVHSRGQIVTFTDDDCIPTTRWLEMLTAPFTQAGTVAEKKLVVQGKTTPWPQDAETGTWARTVWVLRPTWLFETCNIAYRKADFEEAGGFPARHAVPTTIRGKLVGEDALLGWRVVELGADLVFEEGAMVHHRHLPASYFDWLLEQRGKSAFPAIVGRSPVGRRALWARCFLAPRTAAMDLAAAGTLGYLVTRRPRWLAASLPWIWLALPEATQRRGRHPLIRMVQLAAGDLVGVASLAAGSARSRTVVL